jgi:hypothetical protein
MLCKYLCAKTVSLSEENVLGLAAYPGGRPDGRTGGRGGGQGGPAHTGQDKHPPAVRWYDFELSL